MIESATLAGGQSGMGARAQSEARGRVQSGTRGRVQSGTRGRVESGTLARVLFDEAHSEAWTIRPEVAREMQPAHPGDASYARAAAALAEREFAVRPNVDAPLDAQTL